MPPFEWTASLGTSNLVSVTNSTGQVPLPLFSATVALRFDSEFCTFLQEGVDMASEIPTSIARRKVEMTDGRSIPEWPAASRS
jgi:hypothetical protein